MSDSYAPARHAMVRGQIESRGIRDPAVLNAMRSVPRHLFVPPDLRSFAYDDRPLPIGHGQTISQPFIVGLMTELLALRAQDRVLEIGAGSGYQAAILARIAGEVISVERIGKVVGIARENLAAAGVSNVTLIEGDGTLGVPDHAPFDAIIITCAAPSIPGPLKDQLAQGGRLVAPVGGREIQTLVRLVKRGDSFTETNHGGVCFVPMVGMYGWNV
jgi:protein-L-isoaspartate(D-aspartate) O-methyltransferase